MGRHRKALLYDVGPFSESAYISPGDLTELSVVRIGSTVFAVLSSWVPGPGKVTQWSTLAGARAIENICHVTAVTQPAPVSIGHTMAVAPDGTVLARLDEAPGLVTVTIDAALTECQRQADPRALSIDMTGGADYELGGRLR